jgi:hypothetical protein
MRKDRPIYAPPERKAAKAPSRAEPGRTARGPLRSPAVERARTLAILQSRRRGVRQLKATQQGPGDGSSPVPASAKAPAPPNRTALPDRLKAGVESLSGLVMEGVRVHFNSPEPAQLRALAFTKGKEIHLGPGQERHLPHEAWHVVQQMEGRVKPTLQAKGQAINEDCGLEAEADMMGMRAIQVGWPASEKPISRAGAVNSRADADAAIQRKVGFEIEVPTFHVGRGPIPEERKGKKEEEEEQKVPLLKAPDITKGETLETGNGWKLTPDGGNYNWYAEFITDPFDETDERDQMTNTVADLSGFATGLKAKSINKLAKKDYWIEPSGREIVGAFHVTGGIRLDQILALLEATRAEARKLLDRAEEDDIQGPIDIDESERGVMEDEQTILGRAATELADAKKRKLSPEYQGLVGLAGTYVAAQRRQGEKQGAADYGKQYLPIMSRTNLGAIRGKVKDMPSIEVFVADVLEAAGLKTEDEKKPLFPAGLEQVDEDKRMIEAHPKITIGAWLAGFHKGSDLAWSDSAKSGGGGFGLEGVGRKNKHHFLWCIPWGTKQVEGAIVELRNIRAKIAIKEWPKIAQTYAIMFSKLNMAEAVKADSKKVALPKVNEEKDERKEPK